MIRYIIVCVFTSFLCLTCSKKNCSDKAKAISLSMESEPCSLDPRTARDLYSVNVLRMLFEGLSRFSAQGELQLALADRFELSEDRLKYTFHLRPAEWTDGFPVRSSDFVFAWEKILDPQFPTDIAYYLYPIKNARKVKSGELTLEHLGLSAPDPQTLVVELEQPCFGFLELLAMPAFFPVPRHRVEKNKNWASEAEGYVSNGPFCIESWEHAHELILRKNSSYWDTQSVTLDQIHLIIANATASLQLFEQGKLDWVGSPMNVIPIDAVADLKGKRQLQISPFLATYFLRVNTALTNRRGKPNILRNSNLRKALSLAIDRGQITEHILQGGQTPAVTFVPPEMELNTNSFLTESSSIAEARRLYAQAREELGEEACQVVLSYSNNERNAAIAQSLKNQWEEALNVKIELEAVEPKVYFQRISNKEFQLAAGSWTADYNDPINFLEMFKYRNSGTNNTNWESADYIDLLNQSEVCGDFEERKQLLCEAQKVLIDEMPIIPIYHFALNYLKQDEITGVFISPLGQMDMRYAYRQEVVK